MRIEPEGADLLFSRRLAAENGWGSRYAERVDSEYRRFLYLAATRDHPVTPSDEVDQAWHLHLVYTRSYWDDLCGSILGRPLHHGPTAGGMLERHRYREQYQQTLDAYREVFEEDPPADIWPDVETRFTAMPLRIDTSRHLPVDKGSLAATIMALLVGLLALAVGSTTFAAFVMVIGVVLVGMTIVSAATPNLERRLPSQSSGDSGGGGCGADGGCGGGGCGGGCG